MGTKEDYIFDNPLAVIGGFFGVMILAFLFLFRIVQAFVVGGLIGGGVFALLLGAVWWKNFFD